MQKYDLLVFIGRFQPLHLGHQRVIDTAFSMSKNVLVLIGGDGKRRTHRNPFSVEERQEWIEEIYPDVFTKGIKDHPYNDEAWVAEVQRAIKQTALSLVPKITHGYGDLKIGLIGCNKDHSSYYLKLFPEFESVGVEFKNPLNATDIREEFYNGYDGYVNYNGKLDPVVSDYLDNWIKTAEFNAACDEFHDGQEYVKKWGVGPHLCADTIVQVGGHILLVTRKDNGLLAMPGGHLDKYEKFLHAAIRELKEETRLKVPEPVLRGSIVSTRMFDEPHRSSLGWKPTQCYHIKLTNEKGFPEVRGSDDALDAKFYAISELQEDQFHEDHYSIITAMLGI